MAAISTGRLDRAGSVQHRRGVDQLQSRFAAEHHLDVAVAGAVQIDPDRVTLLQHLIEQVAGIGNQAALRRRATMIDLGPLQHGRIPDRLFRQALVDRRGDEHGLLRSCDVRRATPMKRV